MPRLNLPQHLPERLFQITTPDVAPDPPTVQQLGAQTASFSTSKNF